MILPGTYANGFAPRDGEPLFPELWRGCVGAWNPGLGPTGLTLRDWSPHKNHGTLTNMDAGTAWVASQGRYALDFDGSNDRVTTGRLSGVVASASFSIWINQSTLGVNRALFGWWNGTVGLFSQTGFSDSSRLLFLAGSQTQFNQSPAGSQATGLRHLAFVFDGSNTDTTSRAKIFVNGINQPLENFGGGIASSVDATTSTLSIGDASTLGRFWNGSISELEYYNRALSPNEIRLLASRRGIAYEMAPRSWSAQQIAAYRARYYSQLVGGGVI